VTAPWWLGGIVCTGFPAFKVGRWVSTHDEEKRLEG